MSIKYPNTPGVKIQEVSLFPPSVVQVSTAVPVFLGYTEKTPGNKLYRITSLKDYEDNFGRGRAYAFDVTESNGVYTAATPAVSFFLYEAIRLYFMNGGGDCYIISIGTNQGASATVSAADFTKEMEGIEKLDEPTLIVFPEATQLGAVDYGTVAGKSLEICANTQDKFALIDAQKDAELIDPNTGDLTALKNGINANLSYGAVYYPPLETIVKVAYDEANIKLNGTTLTLDLQKAAHQLTLAAVNNASNAIIPPSALMAGVYAKVDRENGVWKAPANVALQGVIKPTVAISDKDQQALNVDANTGKSVNAIREFAGKGTLVWGARTLAGNDNEWRYINVRRLFITVEESIKKATAQFVFENNDAKTWVKVSSMISAYLNNLWKDGALMGAAPSEAYFVQVGLGTTMTQEDILEGKMIVKVGIAAVRPAEFIILTFSHFLNQ